MNGTSPGAHPVRNHHHGQGRATTLTQPTFDTSRRHRDELFGERIRLGYDRELAESVGDASVRSARCRCRTIVDHRNRHGRIVDSCNNRIFSFSPNLRDSTQSQQILEFGRQSHCNGLFRASDGHRDQRQFGGEPSHERWEAFRIPVSRRRNLRLVGLWRDQPGRRGRADRGHRCRLRRRYGQRGVVEQPVESAGRRFPSSGRRQASKARGSSADGAQGPPPPSSDDGGPTHDRRQHDPIAGLVQTVNFSREVPSNSARRQPVEPIATTVARRSRRNPRRGQAPPYRNRPVGARCAWACAFESRRKSIRWPGSSGRLTDRKIARPQGRPGVARPPHGDRGRNHPSSVTYSVGGDWGSVTPAAMTVPADRRR